MVWCADLVLRDREILSEIAQLYCSVAFSITTTDDMLASKLEPGVPLPSVRFRAMEILAKHGIRTGVALMPVLPYLEDSETNMMAVVRRAAESGASFLFPWIGLSMRTGQREYFYAELEELFPGLRQNTNSATDYVMIALHLLRTS
jgi:DNA repair photolyase